MSNFAQLCDPSSYAANVDCELQKWRACVESMGLSAQNGSYQQYSACPGWDRVMMNGQGLYDEEERLSREGRRLEEETAQAYQELSPLQVAMKAQTNETCAQIHLGNLSAARTSHTEAALQWMPD